MKKKICYWLDSNQSGIIPMRDGKIYACCTRAVPILVDKRRYYDELTLDDIQKNRISLYNAINNGTAPQCEGCGCLVEKDEEDIDIGKISYLIYHPHTTCNLKCVYCFFQKNEQRAKLDLHMVDLLAAVKNFHNMGLLKEDFSLELGGGEPLLMENISETIKFLEEYYPKSTLVLVSNYALKDRSDSLVEVLKNKKIKTVLKTSLDCGTRKSYKMIRGSDSWDAVCENILYAAQKGIWDIIYLKYILMEDGVNTDNENVRGFVDFCKKVNKVNKKQTKIILDADMLALIRKGENYFKEGDEYEYTEFKSKNISKRMLKAAKKIYNELYYREKIDFDWIGDRLNPTSKEGLSDIKKIKKNILFLQRIFFIIKMKLNM